MYESQVKYTFRFHPIFAYQDWNESFSKALCLLAATVRLELPSLSIIRSLVYLRSDQDTLIGSLAAWVGLCRSRFVSLHLLPPFRCCHPSTRANSTFNLIVAPSEHFVFGSSFAHQHYHHWNHFIINALQLPSFFTLENNKIKID